MTTFTVTRDGLNPPRIFPASMRLTPSSFGIESTDGVRRGRLRVPTGWAIESPTPLAWFLSADIEKLNFDAPMAIMLELEYADGARRSYLRHIDIHLELETTFSPEKHAWPERNSARVIGEVGPTLEPFLETFKLLPPMSSGVLFRGLYSDIVQLRPSGSHRGGLCSGMARWAGTRALQNDDELPDRDQALHEIKRFHGRQLTDRALLSSLIWFLRASPVAAYRQIRDDALRTGRTLRALDVGVPKPWRRDIAKAVVREGHTIVPYRIRQPSPDRAYVDCYDPNRGQETHTIEFHLDTGRYAYRNMVSLDDDNVGLVAVPHDVYARPGTAILATLGSIIWIIFSLGKSPSESTTED